jgi:hypothetical protein
LALAQILVAEDDARHRYVAQNGHGRNDEANDGGGNVVFPRRHRPETRWTSPSANGRKKREKKCILLRDVTAAEWMSARLPTFFAFLQRSS